MSSKNVSPKVAIVMGSQSDYKTMKLCVKTLKILKIKSEIKILSAHRTPKRMYDFAKKAEKNNISLIVAGAGGSAHLPGMIAALTRIPVIGVPIMVYNDKQMKKTDKNKYSAFGGLDSLLSITEVILFTAKLSTTETSAPFFIKFRAILCPIKPAPPIIKIFLFINF